MGSVCECVRRNETRNNDINLPKEIPEELTFEQEICLQEVEKISELISPKIHNTKNAFMESAYFLLDFIKQRLSIDKPSLLSLSNVRSLRLNIQLLRESLHDIKHHDISNLSEKKEIGLTHFLQLENSIKSNCLGVVTVGFYECDEKFSGLEKIYEKLCKINKENAEKEGKIDPQICAKLTSNISCHFWINSFEGKVARWKDFSVAFQKFAKNTLDYNLNNHELIMIQAEIDYNNDLMIEVDCWDHFYSEIWRNSTKRKNFLQKADDLRDSLLSSSKIQMELKFFQLFPPNEENKEFQPLYFYIHEDKIRYSQSQNLPPREKDFYNNFLLAGKHPKAEISFDRSCKEISSRQFQIHMKKAIIQRNLQLKNNSDPFASESGEMLIYKPKVEVWFILNNMAKKNLVSFLVDEKGYALTKGMIINVNGNSFKVNEINPSPILYAEEDIFYLDTRPKGHYKSGYRSSSQDYFIDLEFFKNGPKDIKKFQFIVPKKEDFFTITIGSSRKRSKRSDIYIEDEDQNYVARDHCFIIFNPKKSCWIIKDETYNKAKLPFYKTFVFSCGYEEYDHIHRLSKEVDYVARGQRLTEGMRFTFLNNYFETKIINN